MAKKKEAKVLEIKPIKLETMKVHVIGKPDSELIMHAWDPKSIKMIEDKQQGVAKSKKKPPRVPHNEYCASMYWLDKNGKGIAPKKDPTKHKYFGIPSRSFKKAMVAACRNIDDIPMTLARGAFHVLGEFVLIEKAIPAMRTDMVRIGQGTSDVRYRGGWNGWEATLEIEFNAGVLTAEQVINLLHLAGFACGVGEWRPSSQAGGSCGMFRVA